MEAAGTNFLQIAWILDSRSLQDAIKVKVTSNLSAVKDFDLAPQETAYNITGLFPGHDYTISMATLSQGVLSNSSVPLDDNTGISLYLWIFTKQKI